jgi:hypothetical protein
MEEQHAHSSLLLFSLCFLRFPLFSSCRVFHGSRTVPRILRGNVPFEHLRSLKHIQFTQCGERPDAADFALMLKLGELNQLCAKDIPFTLFSGDRGFDETLRHIQGRVVQRVDPHQQGITDAETFAILKSITEV